jgi:hypothetical protein
MATREEGMERVRWASENDAHIAMTIWVREDVKSVSTEELSDDELDTLDDQHDASCGITWDIVEDTAREFCYDRTEEANSRKIGKLINRANSNGLLPDGGFDDGTN